MHKTKSAYQRNIRLEYLHTFFRNTNFTHGIWAAFLLFKGFSLLDVGVFETVFHISSLIFEVPTGVFGDLFGRKASRLMGGLTYAIYIALMLLTVNYGLLIIAFIFCGMSYTFESGSGDALVYDSLKEIKLEHRFMKVNGIKEVIYQSATVIVLFLTGWLLEGRYHTDFYLTAGMLVIAMITILRMKETHLPHETQGMTLHQRINDHFVKTFKVVTSNKRLTLLILFGALLLAPITAIYIYGQEYFIFNGFRERWMLYFLAFHALSAAIGGFFAERIEQKIGEQKLMFIVPLLMMLCFWGVLIPYFGFVTFILIGFLDSLFFVVIFDYINKLIPTKTRASVLSFFGMCFSLVMILVFPVVGWISTKTNIRYGYLFVAIVVSLVVIVLQVLTAKRYFVNQPEAKQKIE